MTALKRNQTLGQYLDVMNVSCLCLPSRKPFGAFEWPGDEGSERKERSSSAFRSSSGQHSWARPTRSTFTCHTDKVAIIDIHTVCQKSVSIIHIHTYHIKVCFHVISLEGREPQSLQLLIQSFWQHEHRPTDHNVQRHDILTIIPRVFSHFPQKWCIWPILVLICNL